MTRTIEDLPVLWARLDWLRAQGLYDICFRRAGVGLMFYEGPDEVPLDFKKYLVVHAYYGNLAEAIEQESIRIDTADD